MQTQRQMVLLKKPPSKIIGRQLVLSKTKCRFCSVLPSTTATRAITAERSRHHSNWHMHSRGVYFLPIHAFNRRSQQETWYQHLHRPHTNTVTDMLLFIKASASSADHTHASMYFFPKEHNMCPVPDKRDMWTCPDQDNRQPLLHSSTQPPSLPI